MRRLLRDILALGKPTVTVECGVACAAGLLVADAHPPVGIAVATLAGTSLQVAAANAFNMLFEVDVDARMPRTRRRPLPAGRLPRWVAAAFGLVCAAAGTAVLALWVNVLTAALGLGAIALYALVYTPAKRHTPLALEIGTVPGAMPALMGYTAIRGQVEPAGLWLFAVLVAWQIPHFVAIAMYRQRDYERGGVRTWASSVSLDACRAYALAMLTALVPLAFLLARSGKLGLVFLVATLAANAWLLHAGWFRLRQGARRPARWARGVFLATLGYLPALALGIALDRWVLG